MPDELCNAVVRAVQDNPDRPYTEIADEIGVRRHQVGRILRRMNISRKDIESGLRVERAKHRDPNLREGGIVADDAQWRARQQRIA